MRNLAAFPVTKDEVIECLKRVSDEKVRDKNGELIIGSMDPYLLQIAAETIQRHGIECEELRHLRLQLAHTEAIVTKQESEIQNLTIMANK